MQVVICILYGEAECYVHICEKFTQIKYYTNKSTKYDVYVRGWDREWSKTAKCDNYLTNLCP